MSKVIADSVRDDGLNYISANATALHVCTGDPADRAAAIAASLGSVAPTYTGPTGTGTRALSSDQKTGVTVSPSGSASTVVHIDAVESLWKTDVVGAPVPVAGTMTINAHTLTSGAVT